MKSIILIKQSKNVQLGHLYEHIFCDQVVEHLFDKGIFASVDYLLVGKTYHSGIVVVEFVAYTDVALPYINHVRNFCIDISEDYISTGLNQIEAEEQYYLGYSEFNDIKNGLQLLEASHWQSFSELGIIDTRTWRRSLKTLYISSEALDSTSTILVTLSVNSSEFKKRPELLALIDRVLSVVGINLQLFLSRETGIYCSDESSAYKNANVVYTLAFKTYPGFTLSQKELSDALNYIVNTLYSAKAFDRLCKSLTSIPPSQEYWNAPSVEWIYKSSLQIVGAHGWKRVAKADNIALILRHITSKLKTKNDFQDKSITTL